VEQWHAAGSASFGLHTITLLFRWHKNNKVASTEAAEK